MEDINTLLIGTTFSLEEVIKSNSTITPRQLVAVGGPLSQEELAKIAHEQKQHMHNVLDKMTQSNLFVEDE